MCSVILIIMDRFEEDGVSLLLQLRRVRCTIKIISVCFFLFGVASLLASIFYHRVLWTSFVHVLTCLLGLYALYVSQVTSPAVVRAYSCVLLALFCLWMALHAVSVLYLVSNSGELDESPYYWPVYAALTLFTGISCSFSISAARRMEHILLTLDPELL